MTNEMGSDVLEISGSKNTRSLVQRSKWIEWDVNSAEIQNNSQNFYQPFLSENIEFISENLK